MFQRNKIISAEIDFYRSQNLRLQIEDLLKIVNGRKEINFKKIRDNEIRIEKLYESMIIL